MNDGLKRVVGHGLTKTEASISRKLARSADRTGLNAIEEHDRFTPEPTEAQSARSIFGSADHGVGGLKHTVRLPAPRTRSPAEAVSGAQPTSCPCPEGPIRTTPNLLPSTAGGNRFRHQTSGKRPRPEPRMVLTNQAKRTRPASRTRPPHAGFKSEELLDPVAPHCRKLIDKPSTFGAATLPTTDAVPGRIRIPRARP